MRLTWSAPSLQQCFFASQACRPLLRPDAVSSRWCVQAAWVGLVWVCERRARRLTPATPELTGTELLKRKSLVVHNEANPTWREPIAFQHLPEGVRGPLALLCGGM
jgi:hypothetical protein